MERFSRAWWSQVECVPGCANCCVRHCSHLTENLLCDVHPKLLGVSASKAMRFGRGMGCHITPIEVFTYGVYCPAITKILEAEGFTIDHHTTWAGTESLDDFDKLMDETRAIRGF